MTVRNQFLVTCPSLVTHADAAPIVEGAMLIEHGSIRAVGRRAEFPDTLPMVEFEGTIIPGLVDTHVHLEFVVDDSDDVVIATYQRERAEGILAARALANAQDLLRSGVTTARDCASSLALLGVRRMIADGTLGPRILACGPPITTTAGHLAWVADPVDSLDEIRRRVRELIARGVDAIKLVSSGGSMTAGSNQHQPQFSEEEVRAVVEEAHRLGRRVVAHALNTDAMRRCVAAGVDSIDHARWNGPDGTRSVDHALMARMSGGGTNIGMTGSGWTRKLLRADAGRAELYTAFEVHREVRNQGVFLTLHTDAGSTETDFISIVDSLAVMTTALGVSPTDALRAVTSDAARVLGMESTVGSLAVGHFADFAVLTGDPREDLEHLRYPIAVAKAGSIVHRRQEAA